MITYAIVPENQLDAAKVAKFKYPTNPFIYVVASETVTDVDGEQHQRITESILMRVLESENWGTDQELAYNQAIDAHNRGAKASLQLDKATMKGDSTLAETIVRNKSPRYKPE